MAYFNGYPSYQPMVNPQWQMQPQQPQLPQNVVPSVSQPTINNTLVWVKTQKEAEDYLVAPNNSIVFMDEAMTHLYMKSADQFGRPSFQSKLITDDTPTTNVEPSEPSNQIDLDKYMTKEDFEAWVSDTFNRRLSELSRRNRGTKQNERRDDNA